MKYSDLNTVTELKRKAIKSQQYAIAAWLKEVEKEIIKLSIDEKLNSFLTKTEEEK